MISQTILRSTRASLTPARQAFARQASTVAKRPIQQVSRTSPASHSYHFFPSPLLPSNRCHHPASTKIFYLVVMNLADPPAIPLPRASRSLPHDRHRRRSQRLRCLLPLKTHLPGPRPRKCASTSVKLYACTLPTHAIIHHSKPLRTLARYPQPRSRQPLTIASSAGHLVRVASSTGSRL